MRNLLFVAASLSLLASGSAHAAACKDAKTGKFIKCASAPAPKPTRCKTANGKFAKCRTPGAKPV